MVPSVVLGMVVYGYGKGMDVTNLRASLSAGAALVQPGDVGTGPVEAHAVAPPNSTNFVGLNKGFDSYFNDVRPAFMVLAATEDDIVAGVNFARSMNLRLTVRAGLHNLGGFSFVQGGVVIDLRRMRTITVDTSNAVITFQGGVRFGDLDAKLWSEYPGWAMQNGMDGHIGATGAHLGVGTGWLQRKLQFGTDNIVGVRVVLFNGTVVSTGYNGDPEYADLLFGIRGAACNFGVVTQITERIHNILDPNHRPDFRWANFWVPLSSSVDVFNKLNALGNDPDFPDDLFLGPLWMFNPVTKAKGMACTYTFLAGVGGLAKSQPWEQRFQAIFDSAPGSVASTAFTWWTWQQVQAFTNIPLQQGWYPSGGFVSFENAAHVAAAYARAWETIPASAAAVPFFNTVLFQGGGALARRDTSATALPVGRTVAWLAVQWGGWTDVANSPEIIAWTHELHSSISAWIEFNYLDATPFDGRGLDVARWTYAQNWDRLLDLKSRYDPTNFFSNNVNIPGPSRAAEKCQEAEGTPAPSTLSKGDDAAIILGVVLGIVLLAVVALYHAGNKSGNQSKAASSNPTYKPLAATAINYAEA